MSEFYKPFNDTHEYRLTILPEDRTDILKLIDDRNRAIDTITSIQYDDARKYNELSETEQRNILNNINNVAESIATEADSLLHHITAKILTDIPKHGDAYKNLAIFVKASIINKGLLEGYNKILESSHLQTLYYILVNAAYSTQYHETFVINQDAIPIVDPTSSIITIPTCSMVSIVPLTQSIMLYPMISTKLKNLNKYIIDKLNEICNNNSNDMASWHLITSNMLDTVLNDDLLAHTVNLNKIFFNQLEDIYKIVNDYNNSIGHNNNELKDLIVLLTNHYQVICKMAESTYNDVYLNANYDLATKLIANETYSSSVSECINAIVNKITLLLKYIIKSNIDYSKLFIEHIKSVQCITHNNLLSKDIYSRYKSVTNSNYTISIDTTSNASKYVRFTNCDDNKSYIFHMPDNYYTSSIEVELEPVDKIDDMIVNTHNVLMSGNNINILSESLNNQTLTIHGIIANLTNINDVVKNSDKIYDEFYQCVSNYVDGKVTDDLNIGKIITELYQIYTVLICNNNPINKYIDIPISPIIDFTMYTTSINNESDDITFKSKCNTIKDWINAINIKSDNYEIPRFVLHELYSNDTTIVLLETITSNLQKYNQSIVWDEVSHKLKTYISDHNYSSDDSLRQRMFEIYELVDIGVFIIKNIFNIIANTYKHIGMCNKVEFNDMMNSIIIIDKLHELIVTSVH